MGSQLPSPIDPLSEFAKELAKQLPIKEVYQDGGAPAVRQSGIILEDLTKALHLALAPIQFIGAWQDRFRSFLDRSVRKVPPDRQIAPPPQIIGPVIEAIRYETEGSDLEDMFSELLTSAMDTAKIKYAHPAIAPLLRQLSADEVKLLAVIAKSARFFELRSHFSIQRDKGLTYTRTEDYGLPTDGLRYPENISLYVERFEKLGLIKYDVSKPMQPTHDAKGQTGGYNFAFYRLTVFGLTFMTACGRTPAIEHLQ